MAYDLLTVEAFGARLIETCDLDPIYVGLVEAKLPTDQLHRWLVAYWCFYHAGVASYMSERTGNSFWRAMMKAAENTEPAPNGGRWPRGAERRHFRGAQGIAAVTELQREYPRPERMVEMMIEAADGQPLPVDGLISGVKAHRGFGPWISFKVADMLDRCAGVPVAFDNATIFMFADPVKGAQMAFDAWGKPDCGGQSVTDYVAERLIKHFGELGLKAPPLYDRLVNIQETETCLCKWKSHMRGHYPVGKDIHEIRDGIAPWAPFSPTAGRFEAALPPKV